MKHFQAAQSWTASEKNQPIPAKHCLLNCQVEFIRNLAADLSNVIFVQSSQKKSNLL